VIDSLTVPIEEFDLEGFLEAYRRFHRDWAGDDRADLSVDVLKRHGDTPLSLYEGRDLRGELLERGWLLFFPLHEPLATETALCIDGTRRRSEEFDIGVTDGYGFLVEVSEGQISLHPALYDHSSGAVPRLELQGRCSCLEEMMSRFGRRFVRATD
jgi:hypothetical protein